MTKKLSPEALQRSWDKRMRVYRHNALLGSAGMAKSFLLQVMDCQTTTSSAKQRAAAMFNELALLRDELKTQVDHDPSKGAAT